MSAPVIRRAAAAVALLCAALVPGPAHALKLVTWNVIDYPNSNLAGRQPNLRTVVAALDPDLIAMQELKSQAGADSFRINVLNVVHPGEWSATAFFPTTESAIFYRSTKLTLTFAGGAVATAGPRDVLVARFRPVGYSASSAEFRVYSVHFKAGTPLPSTTDSTTRRQECADLRANINLAPANTQFLIGGDTNFYGDWEGGYIRLTESQADNDGRSLDPAPLAGTWNSFSYRFNHTQSTCASGCPGGWSTGGLDDKFDLWLSSFNLQDGEGTDLVAGSAFPYGNDGQHYNDSVNGSGFNNAVGITVANALVQSSDHLPAVIQMKVPSKIAAESQLDFGTVIAGATANQMLHVTDSATAPADDLDYSLGAPAGFTAPPGLFSALAGNTNFHSIGMSTGSTGFKSGTLAVASDAPDSLTKNVLLSGKVVGHASPSLDSTIFVPSMTLDLGNVETGGFRDSMVAVHNRGYNGLQARLSVNSANIVGGDGRFTIVGGFTPSLVSGVGQRYTIHFDDLGATKDSTYEADLTFANSDEPLPGAITLSALSVHLVARPKQGNVDVPGGGAATLRFYAPRPNPLARETRFAFDLPKSAPVTLEVFDINGRRVAEVISGMQTGGHHEAPWRARDPRGGRLAAGLYFARFVTPGLAESRRLVLLP
jgi:endonuclease/exonuclease/phosphatase family metal-dependent hydrolase